MYMLETFGKFFHLPTFIISLSIGLFVTYIKSPKLTTIYVYPNPTNGIFNISVTLPNIQNVDIKIINPIGQEVVTITKIKTDSFEHDLNLIDFPKGFYILSINTAFNISRIRLILH